MENAPLSAYFIIPEDVPLREGYSVFVERMGWTSEVPVNTKLHRTLCLDKWNKMKEIPYNRLATDEERLEYDFLQTLTMDGEIDSGKLKAFMKKTQNQPKIIQKIDSIRKDVLAQRVILISRHYH
jgi:hypothetical protein